MLSVYVKVFGAYYTATLLILFPSFLLYGLTSGFRVSEKTVRKQKAIQESILFNNNGLSHNLPLFDTTLFIDWKTIETVIYTNYQLDENAAFIFYLTKPPVYTMSEKPLWINKIFPFAMRKKNKSRLMIIVKVFMKLQIS